MTTEIHDNETLNGRRADALPDPLPRIVEVGLAGNSTVHVRFDDGHEGDVDFASTIAIGGIYSPLASREFFGAFRIGRNGRTLEWPAPDGSFDETRVLDFCADALWLEVTDREHPISD